METIKLFKNRLTAGSAFILVVVLTTLLALVGVMFLLTARVDKISASAIAENKQLDAAVETIISQISQQLVADTPGVDPNEEYYDYPDEWNRWLANLEPDESDFWWQVSDIYNKFGPIGLPTVLIDDYQDGIKLVGDSTAVAPFPADADGDGVSDSLWVEIPDMNTSKGEPVFAAVRIIDNSGMLNVNTGYKFDPLAPDVNVSDIDGSSQLQINLAELSQRGLSNGKLTQAANKLHLWRCNGDASTTLPSYETNVIWRYGSAVSGFTPFDISDELKLRNRYIINYNDITTRIEELWDYAYERGPRTPLPTEDYPYSRWPNCVTLDAGVSADYDYKHISTTYNLDRIINPYGWRMVNVNRLDNIDLDVLHDAVNNGLRDGGVDDSALAAQIAVNLKDYSDNDSDITVYGGSYYGFERPCIFISELTHIYDYIDPNNSAAVWNKNDPNMNKEYLHRSYGIEIYKRYPAENNTDEWKLDIYSFNGVLKYSGDLVGFGKGNQRYYVIVFEDDKVRISDSNELLSESVIFSDSPSDGEENVDPDVVLRWECPWFNPDCLEPGYSYDVYFGVDCESAGDCNNTCENVKKADRDSDEYVDPSFIVGNSFTPSKLDPLNPNVTYCWRIDDVNSGGKVIHKGSVWSFTVGNPQPEVIAISGGDVVFDTNDFIQIRRIGVHGELVVDSVPVPMWLVDANDIEERSLMSFQREMSDVKFIKRLWYPDPLGQTLGHYNSGFVEGYYDLLGVEPSLPIPIHFEGRFNNVGEIGKIFLEDMYNIPFHSVGLEEINVRLDVSNPDYQQLFNYLTVFDPSYYVSDANETRIQGRININTAPWYVLAQLPWVSKGIDYDSPVLAQAIVDYREIIDGFASIGQLNNIEDMYVYGLDKEDQMWFPDLSTNSRTRRDGSADDFEERDLIFARISDLVTVRSDVFTAYILVRLGRSGPQKRALAILDRSQVRRDPLDEQIKGKVKVRALYEVPDAR